MKYFVHLALDEFGAEVAGKVHRELSTVSSPEVERHTFVWCGSGAAPAEPDYWASRFPPWNDAVEWPLDLIPQGSGWNLDRGVAAVSIAKFHGLRDKLHQLVEARPRELLGAHVPFRTVVVVAGSLALPTTGAALLGLLALFAAGRPPRASAGGAGTGGFGNWLGRRAAHHPRGRRREDSCAHRAHSPGPRSVLPIPACV
jgi:hypothetical protein